MKQNCLKILPALLIFSFVALACNLPGRSKPAEEQKAPATAAAVPQNPEQVLATAVQMDPNSGVITITLTEAQITAYLASYLATQPDSPLSDPQVSLQNGQVEMDCQAGSGMFSANVHLSFQLIVDENGYLKPQLASADLGPVPAPSGLVDSLSATIDEAFTTAVGPHLAEVKIENVVIADGVIIITGQKR
ncbi:MAG: hypothetical protein GYA59_09065 [Chloroflexi bacterium]|nr:hypothetical protein [Chloroflexota bacterium]